MGIAGKRTLDINEVSQTINLKEYFDEVTPQVKAAFAEAAIETIKTRTLDGKDINNKKFEQYTEEYAKRKGVSRNSVDLFLEGDMLDSIARNRSEENKNDVYIKVRGNLETKKSYNHTVGDTLPRREFFGLTDSEAKKIARSIKKASDVVVEDKEERLTIARLKKELSKLGVILED